MDQDTTEWLHTVLDSVSSMKGVCKSINDYSDIITQAIDALGLIIPRMEVGEDNINEGDSTDANKDNISDDTNSVIVGYKLRKFFPFYWWFGREVDRIIPNVSKSVRVS